MIFAIDFSYDFVEALVLTLTTTICYHYLYVYRWCHDIGREQAANKPLLKTVFQVLFVLSGLALYTQS